MNKNIIILWICLVLLSGCKPTPTQLVKQGIPPQVKISGQISGLPDGVNVDISARSLPTDQGVLVKGFATNGNWQLSVPITFQNYIIEAKATGYTSKPDSYAIRLVDQKVYFVNSDGSATKEASNLDFIFSTP